MFPAEPAEFFDRFRDFHVDVTYRALERGLFNKVVELFPKHFRNPPRLCLTKDFYKKIIYHERILSLQWQKQ